MNSKMLFVRNGISLTVLTLALSLTANAGSDAKPNSPGIPRTPSPAPSSATQPVVNPSAATTTTQAMGTPTANPATLNVQIRQLSVWCMSGASGGWAFGCTTDGQHIPLTLYPGPDNFINQDFQLDGGVIGHKCGVFVQANELPESTGKFVQLEPNKGPGPVTLQFPKQAKKYTVTAKGKAGAELPACNGTAQLSFEFVEPALATLQTIALAPNSSKVPNVAIVGSNDLRFNLTAEYAGLAIAKAHCGVQLVVVNNKNSQKNTNKFGWDSGTSGTIGSNTYEWDPPLTLGEGSYTATLSGIPLKEYGPGSADPILKACLGGPLSINFSMKKSTGNIARVSAKRFPGDHLGAVYTGKLDVTPTIDGPSCVYAVTYTIGNQSKVEHMIPHLAGVPDALRTYNYSGLSESIGVTVSATETEKSAGSACEGQVNLKPTDIN